MQPTRIAYRLGRMRMPRTWHQIHTNSAEPISKLCETLTSNYQHCEQLLKDWTSQGNNLTPESVSIIFEWLTGRGNYRAALRVLRYVRENNATELTIKHCIREITLTCRQHAPSTAERILCCDLPEHMKTQEVLSAFIVSLAKEKALGRAEFWMQYLDTTTAEILDAMMCAYLSRDMHDKVLSAYRKLTDLSLTPSAQTYLTLLKCKERIGNLVPGLNLEEESKAALREINTDKVDSLVLNHMLEAYGYLGNKRGVEDTWRKLSVPSPLYDSYSAGIMAFGLVGEVEKAESILQEVVQSQKTRPGSDLYNVMLEVYTRLGMMEQAERLLKEKILVRTPCLFSPYNSMILGYLRKNKVEHALQKLDEGYRCKQVVPAYRTMMGLLPVFGNKRDVGGAETLMTCYRNRGDSQVYNEMLKVYIAAGCEPDMRLLNNCGIQPDSESRELFNMIPGFHGNSERESKVVSGFHQGFEPGFQIDAFHAQ